MTETRPIIEWHHSQSPVAYDEAQNLMQNRVQAILEGTKPPLVWCLEHPPIYTAGATTKTGDIESHPPFPVHETHRGGNATYHGPGQRILYIMDDLKKRDQDLRAYIARIESWIITVLKELQIKGERREGRVGIWVESHGTEEKIAAIGVHTKRWVTSHGLALNVCPDLEHFNHIVPCGIKDYGVTSLEKLGVQISMEEIDNLFKKHAAIMFP